MRSYGRILTIVLIALVAYCEIAHSGQRRRKQAAAPEPEGPMAGMTIEQMREYQAYFYPLGGRDPLTMRLPTESELGLDQDKMRQAPTREQQEAELQRWLAAIIEHIKRQDYTAALEVVAEAVDVIDNQWPLIRPEHTNLVRMNEEIRNYGSMAARLKNQQDIGKEFVALGLRVDGVIWSPTDAKAVVNGKLLSAGEVMLVERKQGDLRVEIVEEHGVVFQFRGMRFRLPVQVYAPPGTPLRARG